MTAPHEPTDITRAEVAALLSFGNTKEQVCEYLNITDKTLDKYYGNELRTAVIRANANVAKRLYHKAVVQDDLSAQVFWLKTRGRWRTADSERDDERDKNDRTKLIADLEALKSRLDKENIKEY